MYSSVFLQRRGARKIERRTEKGLTQIPPIFLGLVFAGKAAEIAYPGGQM
jgi:hypothetical protein